MRTITLLFISLFLSGVVSAQTTFQDDFESYTAGDMIGQTSPDWTTWSGTTGGAEDAEISTRFAASGSNSLLIQGGGTQDILLPFKGVYTTGLFNLKMKMYVESGQKGYFNLQGLDVVGQGTGIWAFQAWMRDSGALEIDDQGGITKFASAYPFDEWFTMEVNVNLDENIWQFYINGDCLGSFKNTEEGNSVSQLNLYPEDAQSIYYVDDIQFVAAPDATAGGFDFDGGIDGVVDPILGVPGASYSGFTGASQELDITVSNQADNVITSFTLEATNGTQTISKDFTANLAEGESMTVQLDEGLVLENGSSLAVISLTSINGMEDDNLCNNKTNITLNGFIPNPEKAVWVEEATGTWCQFCPRGDVFMNFLNKKYGEKFVGIAVHNDDPMVNAFWDTGLGSIRTGGFPGVAINRDLSGEWNTFPAVADMENPFVSSVRQEPIVLIDASAAFDEDTRELIVDVGTSFKFGVGDDARLIVGLSEDGVTGTTSGYNQINAYANNARGPMGGYESLPASVPASQMVYNHVGRHLFTAFQGTSGLYEGEDVSGGKKIIRSFTTTLPADWDVSNMHIVAAFVPNSSGVVDNAFSISLDEAIAKGLSDIDIVLDSGIEVYPNPFTDIANIRINLETPQEVNMVVTDAMGALVATKNYGTVSGDRVFTFNGANLPSGVYYMKLSSGEQFTTKRVVISH